MNALRSFFGRKNKPLLQLVALLLLILVPALLFAAAGSDAPAGLYALLALLAIVMGLTMAVS
ncbi:MAG TPA: hypothetical protein PKO09_16445 [Anaerolineae bacterium]|nr:hypothetical protein [Anaerolineae bacterium]